MPLIIRTNNYQANNVIIADFHNVNENTLYNLVNGNLDDDNISSITEPTITYSDAGHQHGGGTNGAKISLSQDATPDTFLISATATASGHGVQGQANGTGFAGLRGVGGASDSYGGIFDNGVSGGVSLRVISTGDGSPAEIVGGSGATAGHSLRIVHNSTDGTSRSAIQIAAVADEDHVGLNIPNVEGVGIQILKTTTTSNKSAIVLDTDISVPSLDITAAQDDALQISQTGDTDQGIDINMAGVGAWTGISIDGTGIAGTGIALTTSFDVGVGISGSQQTAAIEISNDDSSGRGIDITCRAIGLRILESVSTSPESALVVNKSNSNGSSIFAAQITNSSGQAFDKALLLTGVGDSNALPSIADAVLEVSSGATASILTSGGIRAIGGKSFINPDPRSSRKAFEYLCLEGPEHGIYWRGNVTIPPGGEAKIPLPDHVHLVQAEGEELDVTATPKSLCIVAARHDVRTRCLIIESNLPGVEVSFHCFGTRRYYEEHRVEKEFDWHTQRKADGSAAQKAYGPN